MALERLRAQWRKASRRYRFGQAMRNRAFARKMERVLAALETDWDLPEPGPQEERYAKMSVNELCAELSLQVAIELRGSNET